MVSRAVSGGCVSRGGVEAVSERCLGRCLGSVSWCTCARLRCDLGTFEGLDLERG